MLQRNCHAIEIQQMFAVIESGGKQHRVAEGDVLQLEKLKDESGAQCQPGEQVKFDRVLMMSNEGNVIAGTPLVVGGLVEGEVVAEGRGPKVRVIKFKRRKNYLRRQGHRQSFSQVRITNIQLPTNAESSATKAKAS